MENTPTAFTDMAQRAAVEYANINGIAERYFKLIPSMCVGFNLLYDHKITLVLNYRIMHYAMEA
jgi:hypothetical protein